MRVGEIIKYLQEKYDENDDIVIAWWDRELFAQYDHDKDEEFPLTKDEWSRAMEMMERDAGGWADDISERAYDFIRFYVDKATEQLAKEKK